MMHRSLASGLNLGAFAEHPLGRALESGTLLLVVLIYYFLIQICTVSGLETYGVSEITVVYMQSLLLHIGECLLLSSQQKNI